MSYHLGIDLGTTYTAAAVVRDGQARIIELGGRTATIPSVVFLREDETILAGEPADRRALTEPGRVAREFKRRIGDPTPLMVGGVPYSADRLASKLLRWVIDQVTEREGGPPDSITITHPANWGPFKRDLMEQAIRNADLDEATMLTEPEAAAIYYASLERVDTGTVLGVYDLGGGTFDAAVLQKTPDGFDVLGRPEGIERLGGIDFDEAVFSHVREALGGAIEELDPDDPTAQAAVARLRRDCVEAKEALSSDTEAVIPVMLPNAQTEVRITRTEFEAMVRPSLLETIESMKRAFRSADVDASEVTSILLVGGSSRIPLISQMVASNLSRPISLDVHPKHAVPLGAAMVAAGAQATQEAPVPVADIRAEASAEKQAPSPEKSSKSWSVNKKVEVERPASKVSLGLIGGAAAAVVAIIIAVIALSGGDDGGAIAGDTTTTTNVPVAVTDETNPTASSTTSTIEQSTTTTSTTTTTAFVDGIQTASISSVSLVGNTYVVDYTTNYDPIISTDPQTYHLHFFWDVYDPATVGTNEPTVSRGAWTLWDKSAAGEMTFDDWSVTDRPAGASAICVVPATFDHQVANVDRIDETYDCMLVPPLEAFDPGWLTLQAGDCITAGGALAGEFVQVLNLSSCWIGHDAEIFAVGFADDPAWPGDESLFFDGDAFCLSEFAAYVGVPYEESIFYYDFFMPTEESWAAGDREVICVIFDEVDALYMPVQGSGM